MYKPSKRSVSEFMAPHKMRLLLVFVCGLVSIGAFPSEVGQYVIEAVLDDNITGIIGEEVEDVTFLRADLNANDTFEVQTKVLYTGSQVWKVKIENTKQLRVLSELRKQKGERDTCGNMTIALFLF